MSVSKPKINRIPAFSFLTKEDLIYLGVIPRDFFPNDGKSPEQFIEKSLINEENDGIIQESPPEDLLRLKKSFSNLLNIEKAISYTEMDKLRGVIQAFLKAKDLFETSPRRGVNFARFFF